MVTILEKSVQGESLRNFRTLSWNSSNILPETATKTFWQIRTNFRKHNFLEFLKMKDFFLFLSLTEYRCLLDAPGVLSDRLFVEAKIARQTGIEIEVLTQRLNILQRLENRREWNINLLYTLLGVVRYQMEERRSAIRPATKFSGYVKNSSQVGSKSHQKLFIPEPEIVEWTKPVEINYLHFLTVGEFPSGTPGGDFFTLTRTRSPKRKPNNLRG